MAVQLNFLQSCRWDFTMTATLKLCRLVGIGQHWPANWMKHKHRLLQHTQHSRFSNEALNNNWVSTYQESWSFHHAEPGKILRRLSETESRKIYGDKAFMKILCDSLDIDSVAAQKILRHKQFSKISVIHIQKMLSYLQERNITAQHIMKAPWLLWQISDQLDIKFDLLEKPYLFNNYIDGLGFSLYGIALIHKYQKMFMEEESLFPRHKNRIYYIAQNLNLPVDFFTMKIAHAWHVLHLSKLKLDDVINIFLEYKLTPNTIFPDPWVFLHNIDQIKGRLQKSSEECKIPPKPWVCHCTDFSFERFRRKRKAYKIGENNYLDLPDLITSKLKCDVNTAKIIIEQGGLDQVDICLLAVKIDTLISAGISVEKLRNHPTLLRYSQHRIARRVAILNQTEYPDVPPSVLILPETKFSEYVRKLKM